MASKKLSYDQIAEPNLLSPLVSEIKEVEKALEAMSKQLKDTVSESAKIAKTTPFDAKDLEGIEKVEKATGKAKKALSELEKLEQKRAKIKEQLIALESEQAKQTTLANERLKERRKELRDEAKAVINSGNAYKKLSKDVADAEQEFKKLAAQYGVNSKEAKEANDRLLEMKDRLLDIDKAAKDGRRNVGRYRESLEGINIGGFNAAAGMDALTDGIKAFMANPIIFVLTALAAALATVFKAFQKSERGTVLLRKGAALLEAGFAIFTKAVNDAIIAIEKFVEDPIQGIKDFGKAIADNLTMRFEKLLSAVNGLGTAFRLFFEGEMEKAAKAARKAGSELLDVATGIEDTEEKSKKAKEELEKMADAFLALEAAQRAVRAENRKLRTELVKVTSAQELLTAQAGDDGRTLQEQRKAIQEAGTAREKQAEIELRIARNNLKLLNDEIALRRSYGQSVEGLLDEQAEAQVAFLESEKEFTLARFENEEQERQIILDIMDQELDDLIDFADNNKAIKERIAADDESAFELRRQAVEQARQDIKRSLELQVKEIEDSTNALFESLGKEADFSLPIDELLAIEDTEELVARTKTLGLVERQRIRLLEIIREQRTAEQDFAEATADVNNAQKESNTLAAETEMKLNAILKLREEGANAEEILQKLESDTAQLRIENLQKQIEALPENSEKRIALEAQLQDAILSQEQKRLNEEVEANKKAEQEKIEAEAKAQAERDRIRRAGFETLRGLNEKLGQETQDRISEELEATKNRRSELQELADQGIQDAEENLALQQKRQAQLERQQEQAARRQQQIELALAAVETYTAYLNDGKTPGEALGRTVTDISIIQGLISSLPAFYEGSERVGDDLKPVVSGKDGHIIRVDGSERILSPSQNAMIPRSMTNTQLAVIASMSAKNESGQTQGYDFSRFERKLNELVIATKQKPTYLGQDYDARKQSVTDFVKEKSRLERKHRRNDRFWG